MFVATWNVGGKPPDDGLDLKDFLRVHDSLDIYVLGFQEIVPLNAGNVLVIEDNEPATKWLSLIDRALNKPAQATDMTYFSASPSNHSNFCCSLPSNKMVNGDPKAAGGLMFFQKPSLKTASKNFRTGKGRHLKSCNCPCEVQRKHKDSCFRCQDVYVRRDDYSYDEDSSRNFMMAKMTCSTTTNTDQSRFSLIVSKQMVGIFVTIWVREELVRHIGHLRISCVGRGILGCFGNKGCISVSMSLHQTSFCFICSHLAAGEKEGDELRRNSDVIEILKNTQFPKICKKSLRKIPEKILEHDRVIWFGDLNYRIALSYLETTKLLKDEAWEALFNKDQLKIEREAGRIFVGWKEGKIYFAPTYKYSDKSDVYAGVEEASKKKRRNPAWCDRILWYGDDIKQLSYFRCESKFSDHRPVCAVFVVEVALLNRRSKKGLPTSNIEIEVEESLPPSGSYMALRNMYQIE